MKTSTLRRSAVILAGCLAVFSTVSANVHIGITQVDNMSNPQQLMIFYLADANYTTPIDHRWNSQIFTLRWPVALGSDVIGTIENQAAFVFSPDGLPADGGDGFFYQKFASAATNVLQNISTGQPLNVLMLELNLPDGTFWSFELVTAPNTWVIQNNGSANVENATLAEQFHLFSPSSASGVTLSKSLSEITDKPSLYPNPASGLVYLDWFSPVGETISVEVFSETGRLVVFNKFETVTGFNQLPINLQNLQPGKYLLRAVSKYQHFTNLVIVTK